MSIFSRRHHTSSKPKPAQPVVVPEEQEELNQLQDILMRKKRSSKTRNSPSKQEDLTPDFKDALHMVIEKRKKKLANRNKIQTYEVKNKEEVVNVVPDEVIEASIPIDQVDIVKSSETQAPVYRKPRKKKAKANENSIATVSSTTKKTTTANTNTTKPKKAAATAVKPKKTQNKES